MQCVENLVENEDEMKAQGTDEKRRSPEPSTRIGTCMSMIINRLCKFTTSIECGSLVKAGLKDNLHRNVAISNVKVN